jgi:FemAB-related protein (PEP-CTERM system-associated)
VDPQPRIPKPRRNLLDAARSHADDSGCDYLEIRATRPLGQLPSVSDKVSMTVSLRDDPEALMDEFSRKHRKNIRSTYSQGIVVRSGGAELLEPFYGLMRLSWRALGTPLYRKAYFAAIMDAFGDDVRIFVAYHEGRPIATAFNGHSTDTVEGMWAAMDPAQRRLQPNYVLYWEMIKDACERRYRQFHLGRSTVGSGAAQFKAKWQAEPKPLFWNYHLVRAGEIPALNPDNPRYGLAIRAWRMLPLIATDVLGPRLARLIP